MNYADVLTTSLCPSVDGIVAVGLILRVFKWLHFYRAMCFRCAQAMVFLAKLDLCAC